MFIKHIVPGHLQCLLPIGHRFLFKRFSAKLGGRLLKLLPFIMKRILETSESSTSQFQEAILTL